MVMIPMGVYAHCQEDSAAPHSGDHRHCDSEPPGGLPAGGGGGNREETFYNVAMVGVINGHNTLLWSTFAKAQQIGLGDGSLGHNGVGAFENLNFFTSMDGPFQEKDGVTFNRGERCFGKEPAVIHQGAVSLGKFGEGAEAGFFFEGFTHTKVENDDGDLELVPINYLLKLTGVFSSGTWPPTDGHPAVLVMMAWELSATNEGKRIKEISCIGKEAPAVTITTITVTGPVE